MVKEMRRLYTLLLYDYEQALRREWWKEDRDRKKRENKLAKETEKITKESTARKGKTIWMKISKIKLRML